MHASLNAAPTDEKTITTPVQTTEPPYRALQPKPHIPVARPKGTDAPYL